MNIKITIINHQEVFCENSSFQNNAMAPRMKPAKCCPASFLSNTSLQEHISTCTQLCSLAYVGYLSECLRFFFFNTNDSRGRDGSVVKSTRCSWGEPKFGSPKPDSGL